MGFGNPRSEKSPATTGCLQSTNLTTPQNIAGISIAMYWLPKAKLTSPFDLLPAPPQWRPPKSRKTKKEKNKRTK
jgi:hypothetical protein